MKKLLSILLCVTLACGLAACSDEPPRPTETIPPTAESLDTTPTETTESTGPEDPFINEDLFANGIGNVTIDGVALDVNNCTVNTLRQLDFVVQPANVTTFWKVDSSLASLYGTLAVNSCEQELYITADGESWDEGTVYAIGVESSDIAPDCYFYNGIRLDMFEEDLVAILDGMEYELTTTVDGIYYKISDETNSLIAVIRGGVVKTIFITVDAWFSQDNENFNKDFVFDGNVHKSDEKYESWYYKTSDPTQWEVSIATINTSDDVFRFTLDGVEYNFNEMKTGDIYKAGYAEDGALSLITFSDTMHIGGRFFYNSGAKIFVLNDPQTYELLVICVERVPLEGEALWDESDVQTDAAFYNGLRPGMSVDEIINLISDDSIEIPVNGYVILKSEANTLMLVTENGLLSAIYLFNNAFLGL